MKAYGFKCPHSPPILFEQITPIATGHDLLVEIDAIAVNPVDIKVKASIKEPVTDPKIIGWDACGKVVAIGEQVRSFSLEDRVFYAGDITRAGCYASHQLVNEHIVGKAPLSKNVAEIAAMPLTSITAWESLFSRLKINSDTDKGKHILIIGGAGGVGSIAIQLAKTIAKLNVIATASRTESAKWCYKMGADYVINHHHIIGQYLDLKLTSPDYILCLNDTDKYFTAMVELIAPQGMICAVVDSKKQHDLSSLKRKSAGFVWEFMFTPSLFNTANITSQGNILNKISQLLDNGVLASTLTNKIGAMTPKNIEKAHQQLLTGKAIGKIALTAIE